MKPIRFRLPLFVLSLLAAATLLLAHDGPHHPGLRPDDPDDGSSASDQLPAGPDSADAPEKAEKAEKKGADKKGDAKAGDKKDEKKWDVDNPPGPSSNVTIDVDEGTWMSVDVSPDGTEVAFDLLGDIYTMPIAGGEAKILTKDMSWQEHPRYSPDGKSIAFISDQAGGDNIWVMKRDGKDAKQVSKETFRLVNSPAWTPDGQFIVARKHFTSRRSLGAGEMWLYHRSGSGSGGLQMTKKPNEQKDAGEPAFSPDGRYLYYSQDTTPGRNFEYNKDPNGQIYTIQRLDRQSGETEELVTGAGGSVRPTPSPDGKTMAFIRRVRAKSVIYLKDLASGEEWPVYDALDRDMQEGWAIHGLYPPMAWTPDGKSLVFWSGGKIRRLETATKVASVIPFHVKTTKKVMKPLRFPVEVAPASFDTKMLRWTEVSPAGDKVVFQALGYLWIRDLQGANARPRRLTTQKAAWEVFPSFSRDGKQIVYTTWNDDSFGTIRVVPVEGAEGGDGREVLGKLGQYVAPAFSPDGTTIVYQKVAGGFTRSNLWSAEPGIYKIPATGGEPFKLTPNGASPHFGAEGTRVYFSRRGEEGKPELASIGLDGREERTHLKSEKALEFKVSPDGQWVAFTELYNAYVMPFVPTGQAIDVGPGTSSIPLRKATREAGEYLHWSGDSKRLHWSLGPELYTQELKDAFAFLEGAPEKLPDPPTKGIHLGFNVLADTPTGAIAVTGGKVVTMKGEEIIEGGTVLIEGNRIKAVGPAADVKVPAGAYVIDAKGKTVVPGLIDVHWHGGFGDDGIVPQNNWVTGAALAYGVTTLHDPSNDTDTVFAASELGRAGLITAPRIFSTGTILYGADAPYTTKIESLEDARGHLRRLKAAGAFSVKSYNQPRREQRQQVIAAARELGMMVVPEGGSLFQYNMTMIVDGHTGIEHSLPVSAIYNDVRQLWKSTPVGYTPTMVVAFGTLSGEYYWYDKTHVWEDQRLLNFVPREIIDARSRRRISAPEEEYGHIQTAKIATDLSRLGVTVNVGAHGQRESLGAHWEMWMFNQGGSTPWESLRNATINGARYLGLDKDLGSLEPGKLADLVILDGDVLTDLRKSTNIGQVIANGRVYDSMTLDQLYPEPKKRAAYYFQKGHGEKK